ncbi:MAG: RNA 2',3'-cyclic phosphodiesterase [Syntrophus sp. SKADARSKE-3]|nr:RNA 2',3'-cyclic phosphodiesterase [Syntrophus sp. SKADARSKE-3]
MSEQKDIRAFLAIEAPIAIREEMGRIQNRLKKTVQGMIRWTGPTAMHLTLKFFGDISGEDIDAISAIIKNESAGLAPLQLTIKSIGVFPNPRKPRVIWLGTRGDTEQLVMLQRKLERGFGGLGFPEENRPFRAHWTLARIKSPQGLTGLDQAIETGRDLTAGTFQADTLILFKSDLRSQGPIYTRLAEYSLTG